jgi:signal transduction histidine kinase
MTAGVMHEIGNPLAAIKTKIQVAEEEGAICDDCVQLRSEVIGEVDRLASFLRSFSRLAKVPRAEFERLAPDEIVRSIARLMSPELQRRGISLRWESEPGTPLIDGNSNQLGQLLINLILNAAEASPRSGVIRIRLLREPGQDGALSRARAVLVVTDDGVGIRPEDLERIFDQFFTTKSEGTGLGLAICREIVEDHGGTIAVTSERGRGTEVRVSFPAAAGGAPDGERLTAGGATSAPAPGWEGGR